MISMKNKTRYKNYQIQLNKHYNKYLKLVNEVTKTSLTCCLRDFKYSICRLNRWKRQYEKLTRLQWMLECDYQETYTLDESILLQEKDEYYIGWKNFWAHMMIHYKTSRHKIKNWIESKIYMHIFMVINRFPVCKILKMY